MDKILKKQILHKKAELKQIERDALVDWKRIAFRLAFANYINLIRAGYGHEIALARLELDLSGVETNAEILADEWLELKEPETLKEYLYNMELKKEFKKEIAEKVKAVILKNAKNFKIK